MNNIHISMVIMVFAIVTSTVMLQLRCRKKWKDIKENIGIVYASLAILLGVLGGRLYYFLLDVTNTAADFFVPNMQFGMYGVFAGVILAAVIVCLIFKLDLRSFLDVLAQELLVVLMAQRINDFFLGTNFGRLVENDILEHFPISVFFSIGDMGFYVLAIFAYEFIWCLLIFVLLIWKKKNEGKGLNFATGLGMYCFGRVVFESMRQDSIYTGFVKIAQVVSIVLALTMLITVMVVCTKKKVINIAVVIISSIVIAITVTIAFLCEFYMGSEVETLYTGVIAGMMVILAMLLISFYMMYFERFGDTEKAEINQMK